MHPTERNSLVVVMPVRIVLTPGHSDSDKLGVPATCAFLTQAFREATARAIMMRVSASDKRTTQSLTISLQTKLAGVSTRLIATRNIFLHTSMGPFYSNPAPSPLNFATGSKYVIAVTSGATREY